MADDLLARRLHDAAHLTGDFLLRSGARSEVYFDKYRFESDPVLLRDLAQAMAALVPDGCDALAGLELGGVPLATAMSQLTGLPSVFVRKEAKQYGTARLAEGGEVSGRRLVVVEDVVTSGGQVVESVGALRELGAVVEVVVCAIDREGGGAEALAAHGLRLRAAFTKTELDAAAAASAAMGETERAAPAQSPDLRLEAVTRENVDAVLQLSLRPDQEHLVGSAASTIAYAHYEPESILRAVTLDGVPVGVLLVLCEEAVPYLVRFHIDAEHQGRGIGRQAVELLVAELGDAGWPALETSYVPVEDGAGGFWERMGFEPTGRLHDGEPLVRRELR